MSFSFGNSGASSGAGFSFAGSGATAPAFGVSATSGGLGFGASTGAAAAPAGGGFGGGFGASSSGGGFGSTGATAGGFGAPASAAAAAGTGFGFGASSTAGAGGTAPAASGAGFGGGGGFGATGAAKPAAGGFGGGFGASSSGGGFGSTGATAGGFGAPASAAAAAGTGFGFGASSTAGAGGTAPAASGAGFGGGGGFGATGAAKPAAGGFAGGFGVGGSGAGFGATGAASSAFGGGVGASGAGGFGAVAAGANAGGADAPVPLANQHHIDAMNFIVQPLRGMGNFLGTDVVDAKERKADELKKEPEKEKIERKAARESIEVYRAINEQLIAWSPWDPAVMTQNAKLQQQGHFKQVEQLVGQLQRRNGVERERVLATYAKEHADLARLALLPRFDAETINAARALDTKPSDKRKLVDVIENQSDPCAWKPEVDNPHCRFRHYILQPLTQAQMRLPASQRYGFSQSASSSPNDPLFQSKLQENPNPYKYCVLPIVGFHQLERRIRMQDDQMAEQSKVMKSFEHELVRMREFQSVEYPIMLAQRRAKQVELGRRTVELLRRLQQQQRPNSAPSRWEDEERRGLNDGLDQLRQELQSATMQRQLQQLEELMAEIRMQDRRRLKQRSVASPACDQLALERLDKFLQHRLKGIRHISDIVEKDFDDTQIMLQHLAPPP